MTTYEEVVQSGRVINQESTVRGFDPSHTRQPLQFTLSNMRQMAQDTIHSEKRKTFQGPENKRPDRPPRKSMQFCTFPAFVLKKLALLQILVHHSLIVHLFSSIDLHVR